jgi:hypothetical protein
MKSSFDSQVFSLQADSQVSTFLKAKVKVKVTIRLAVYRQSVGLRVKPLEAHEQRPFFSSLNTCGHSPYAKPSLTRRWV